MTLASSSPSWALQLIEAKDGATVHAMISLKEPTRLRVQGSAITDVVGNLYSASHCDSAAGPQPETPPAALAATGGTSPAGLNAAPVNRSGELVIECNKAKGEVYLRPVATSSKPINLFVSTARATYTLLLAKADRPADTIVIRDTATPLAGPAAAAASSHVRALKSMLRAMTAEQAPGDLQVRQVGQPVALWEQARFELQRIYEGRGLIGEVYQLTNVSPQAMVLADQEFDREQGDVAAVSVEDHNLPAGASTAVYVIRLGERP